MVFPTIQPVNINDGIHVFYYVAVPLVDDSLSKASEDYRAIVYNLRLDKAQFAAFADLRAWPSSNAPESFDIEYVQKKMWDFLLSPNYEVFDFQENPTHADKSSPLSKGNVCVEEESTASVAECKLKSTKRYFKGRSDWVKKDSKQPTESPIDYSGTPRKRIRIQPIKYGQSPPKASKKLFSIQKKTIPKAKQQKPKLRTAAKLTPRQNGSPKPQKKQLQLQDSNKNEELTEILSLVRGLNERVQSLERDSKEGGSVPTPSASTALVWPPTQATSPAIFPNSLVFPSQMPTTPFNYPPLSSETKAMIIMQQLRFLGGF